MKAFQKNYDCLNLFSSFFTGLLIVFGISGLDGGMPRGKAARASYKKWALVGFFRSRESFNPFGVGGAGGELLALRLFMFNPFGVGGQGMNFLPCGYSCLTPSGLGRQE
jgi:hypothetical protein